MVYFYSIMFFCIAIASVSYYFAFISPRKKMNELAAMIPGPPRLPLIGNALWFYGSNLDIANNIKKLLSFSQLYDGILKIYFGPFLYIGIFNPDDIELVLRKELNRGPIYHFLKPWMGDSGLVCGDLSVWKPHRKVLQPTFDKNILDGFVETFVEKSDTMVKKFMTQKGTFNAFDIMSTCSMDILCETMMGVQLNSQDSIDSSYIEAIINIPILMMRRLLKIWQYSDWIYGLSESGKKMKVYLKTVKNFNDYIIREKIEEFKNNKIIRENTCEIDELYPRKRKTFIELITEMSEEGLNWSHEEIRDEVDNLMATGSETNARTTSFALLMLGVYPQIQEKVFDELYEIFGNSGRSITVEDLPKMEYMERVIKETLRLYPTVPLIGRDIKQDVKLEKYTLPAGSTCVVCIYGVHRDKQLWGDKADEFDPDNFLPEKCEKRHPHAFIPFSSGSRNCFGRQYSMMAMKVMLASILRSVKVQSTVNPKEVQVIFELLTKPVGGYPISMERRT